MPVSQGVRVLRAEDPLVHGQQPRRTGPGPRPGSPPPQSTWRGCCGWSGFPGAPGRGPVPATGSSPANRSRAPAGSPASPGPAGQFVAGGQGARVLGAEHPLVARAAARRTGPGRRPDPPPPQSSGPGCAGEQGARVLWAEDPFPDGQQRRELVPGPGRVPRLPGPVGQAGRGRPGSSGCSEPRTRSSTGSSAANWSRAAAGSPACPVQRARLVRAAQGVRVLRAEDPLVHGQQRGELVPGPGRVSRLPGPAGEPAAGQSGCPGARRRGSVPGRQGSLRRSRAAA